MAQVQLQRWHWEWSELSGGCEAWIPEESFATSDSGLRALTGAWAVMRRWEIVVSLPAQP